MSMFYAHQSVYLEEPPFIEVTGAEHERPDVHRFAEAIKLSGCKLHHPMPNCRRTQGA